MATLSKRTCPDQFSEASGDPDQPLLIALQAAPRLVPFMETRKKIARPGAPLSQNSDKLPGWNLIERTASDARFYPPELIYHPRELIARASSPVTHPEMTTLDHIRINDQLPSPKGVALAILELSKREETNYHDLARVIQVDPALAGRLIKLANSAHAHTHRPAVSVNDAIARLGLAAVRNLALGFSLIDEYREGPCQAFDYEVFWSHSLLMALTMQFLATPSGLGSVDELFVCGLLAQIGCLAMATAYPVEYSAILLERSDIPLLERERQHLHTDHNELTAALLLEWGIPHSLAEPLYFHETPAAAGYAPGSRQHRLVQHFHLAKCVVDLATAAKDEYGSRVDNLLLRGSELGLDEHKLSEAVDNIMVQWQEWGELLNVPASALPAFSHLSPPEKTTASVESAANDPLVDDTCAGTPTPLRILVATAEWRTKRLLMDQWTKDDYQVAPVSDGQHAIATAVKLQPQLVLIDQNLPSVDGMQVCRVLRATQWGRRLYIIMMLESDAAELQTHAFEAGADNVLCKPFDISQVRARLQAAYRHHELLQEWELNRTQLRRFAAELATTNRQLSHAAMTDPLTGLPNRRSGMEFLAQAWSVSIRTRQPLAVLIIDIDYFKDINDTFGHDTGDNALREIGQVLQRAIRHGESISRIGGEEFLIVYQNTDALTAVRAAERLRTLVADLEIQVDEALIRPTLSIGVAAREPQTSDPASLVREADRALYHAKRTTRNCVCLSHNNELDLGPWVPHPAP